MKLKVILAGILVVLMAISFAACGGNEETTTETKEQTTLADYWETEEVLGEEISPEE